MLRLNQLAVAIESVLCDTTGKSHHCYGLKHVLVEFVPRAPSLSSGSLHFLRQLADEDEFATLTRA
jgi:hypothetical protein